MKALILNKLAVAIGSLFLVSLLTFSIMNLSVDPAIAIAGEGGTAADIEKARQNYGLDQPLLVRYGQWMVHAAEGDFGQSYRQRRPVFDILMERLPVTLTLGVFALVIALAVSIPLGVIAAMRPNSIADRLALFVALSGQAMPSFWFSLLLILVFGVWWAILPISGSETIWHYVMPAVALGYYAMPALMRLTRAGMLEALEADYIRTARAKGLSEFSIVVKHALRNALLPVVAIAAVQFGFMLGGSVVLESVFAMRGIGYLAWEAISQADLPVIQAIVLLMSVVYVVLTMLADLLNSLLDPRLRVK